MHRGFLAEAQRAGSYEAIRVAVGSAVAEARRLALAGYHGLNITTPLKEEVLGVLESADDDVAMIGAANTLIRTTKGGWHGANTDGIGAVEALEEALGVPVSGRRILLLGTGATTRAAWVALHRAGARLRLWARREERARDMLRRLDAAVAHGIWHPGDAAEESFDAVFAALPPDALLPATVLEGLRATPCILDANYGERARLGALLGRAVTDGQGMLIAQARASFLRWQAIDFGEGEI